MYTWKLFSSILIHNGYLGVGSLSNSLIEFVLESEGAATILCFWDKGVIVLGRLLLACVTDSS